MVAVLSDVLFLKFLVSYVVVSNLPRRLQPNVLTLHENPDAILADLASMILSNLTASPTACSAIINLNIPVISNSASPNRCYATESRCGTCPAPVPYPSGNPRSVLALPLLVDAFVQGAQVDSTGRPRQSRKGELHFLASVFANLTAVRHLLGHASHNIYLVPDPSWPRIFPVSTAS
jgi:hypothetical protein